MEMTMIGLLVVGLAACVCSGCGCSGNSGNGSAITEEVVGKVRSLHAEMASMSVERGKQGLPPLFPAIEPQGDDDDIAGMTFKNSTEYFKVLFDCENYGAYEWAPYIEIKERKDYRVPKLKGRCMPFVPPETGVKYHTYDNIRLAEDGDQNNLLTLRNDLIIVTFRDFDRQSDQTPLFISSNVNPENLKLPISAKDKTVIPIGSKAGRDGYAWKDDCVLIVRKGGRSEVIPADEFTRARFCGGDDIPAGAIGFLDVK